VDSKAGATPLRQARRPGIPRGDQLGAVSCVVRIFSSRRSKPFRLGGLSVRFPRLGAFLIRAAASSNSASEAARPIPGFPAAIRRGWSASRASASLASAGALNSAARASVLPFAGAQGVLGFFRESCG